MSEPAPHTILTSIPLPEHSLNTTQLFLSVLISTMTLSGSVLRVLPLNVIARLSSALFLIILI